MPVHRFGLVGQDPSDTATRRLTTLPWADAATEALARYREQQPAPGELARADACQMTPAEMLDNPHLKVGALENELAQMFRNFLVSLEQTLDEKSARKVAYAAGLAHGKRRLGTFLSGQGLPGGVKSMAMWQGYQSVDPRLSHVEELQRERPDGKTEFVTRFRYLPKH